MLYNLKALNNLECFLTTRVIGHKIVVCLFLQRGARRIYEPVEDLARPHDSLRLGGVRVIVAPNVDTLPLALHQLLGDLSLGLLELLGQAPPGSVPSSQGLGPVEGQVVVTPSIVQLSHLSSWGLI